jgi:hypothetical protein
VLAYIFFGLALFSGGMLLFFNCHLLPSVLYRLSCLTRFFDPDF